MEEPIAISFSSWCQPVVLVGGGADVEVVEILGYEALGARGYVFDIKLFCIYVLRRYFHSRTHYLHGSHWEGCLHA